MKPDYKLIHDVETLGSGAAVHTITGIKRMYEQACKDDQEEAAKVFEQGLRKELAKHQRLRRK